MKQEELRRAFDRLDIEKCKTIIASEPASLDRDNVVLRLLRQSGCLMVQFPNPNRERKRTEAVEWLDSVFDAHSDNAVNAGYHRYRKAATAAEIGFRGIAATRDRAMISALDAPLQAWAVIHRATVGAQHSDQEFSKAAQQTAKGTAYVDLAQVRLGGMEGTPLSPDDILESMVNYAGLTLKLLAHKEGWFDDQTADLVLPREVEVSTEDQFKAGSHAYLATRWSDLEIAWERARWLDSQLDVVIETVEGKTGPFDATVIVGEDPNENDLLGQISVVRMREVLMSAVVPLLPQWEKLHKQVSTTAALRNCEGCLTEWEFGALEVFDSVFHWPLQDQTQTFDGLSLRAWIRGYSFLASIQGHDLKAISRQELINGLVEVGHSVEQASAFVGHATFGRATRDLFDAPLLRVSDGSYRIFPPAVTSPNIANIVASRLASIRRESLLGRSSCEATQFEQKGPAFEKAMLKLLTEAGVNAASFEFRCHDTDYDCDLAAIIDDTLFVFECKNYSLPMGRVSELSHWIDKLRESRRQVARIAKDLDEHPEIVLRHLGENVCWTRVIPCVLQALPWSQGKGDDGVYVYDQSALIRVIESGVVRFLSVGGKRGGVEELGPNLPLRSGAIPTADELIHELTNPVQLRSQKPACKVVKVLCPITESMGIRVPYWSAFPMSVEERVASMGFSPEEQKKVMSQLSRPTWDSSMFAQALENLGRQSRPVKQGRNEACRCGSGLKNKKCCGRVG